MNRNVMCFIAALALPALSALILYTNAATWLETRQYTQAAALCKLLRGNALFQDFVGGWVFPCFIAGIILFWLFEEDADRIPTQFLLLPLFYIPFSIVGFTLANAEFQLHYLYVNPLVILTFGYLYVLLWQCVIALFIRIGLVMA